jgi:hypothetical protein
MANEEDSVTFNAGLKNGVRLVKIDEIMQLFTLQ